MNTIEVWDRQAAHWNRLGPPLRPAPADLRVAADVIRQWSCDHGPPRALLLGVTPEFAKLAWPQGTSLLAVDRSEAMVRGVWPGYPHHGAGALCTDWLAMAIDGHSRDIVLADGALVPLRFRDEQQALLAKLKAIVTRN